MKKTLFFALFAATAPAFALTTVQLKSGASIEAEVISEKADRIVVDLGFEVVTIPRDEIESLTAKKAGVADVVVDNTDLYRVAANPSVLSVKENVDRVGEAVVLIRTPIGLGSGFLIHPAGYIVTNAHVVSGEYNIYVTQFRRGATELEKVQFNKVRIVAIDARLDLALLKIDDAGTTLFPTVPMGDGGSINDGQTVFAIGSPLGLDRTVSQGIVSAHARPMDGQLYIQTTTQINPGNSGGPLFNLRGEVVGVNNMKAMQVGIEGLNFAIPSTVLKDFLRNRDAFAFDPRNPNAGYRYLEPPQPVKKSASQTNAAAKPTE
jgi:serine protease Do